MKNNKKGFTLVELLAVIVLIALISVLAVSGITSANKKTKQRILSSKIVTVEEGLRSWNMNNENCFRSRDAINCVVGLGNGCTADQNIVSCFITIGELARQNIIEADQVVNGEKIVINPVDNSSLNNEIINFTYDSAKRIFIFEENSKRIENKVSTTTKNNRSTTTSEKVTTTTTTAMPTVNVVATKMGTNDVVESEEWTNSYLSIKFIASTSNSPIFYCVDKTNNCTPNTSISNNGSYNLTNVESAIYYVRYRIDNNTEIGIFQARLDFDAPSQPTMTFVDGEWNTYASGSKSYRTLYAAQASGKSDNTCDTQKGAPSGSVDELSGASKYQISRDNTNWEDYNYDCASNTLGNTLYKMMTYENHTRYFRACDKAGNCSGSTTVSATIENTKPTISVTTFKYDFFNSSNGNLGELVKLPEVYSQDTTYIVSEDWLDYNTIFMINSLSPAGIKSIEYKMNEDGITEDTGDTYINSATADGNGEESVVRFPVLLNNGYRKMQWTATSTDDKKTTITIIAKINVPTPVATIKAYKKGTNNEVAEGTKSDTGLDYIITKGENINSNVKIYYCKETSTTLCPSDFTKWEETTSGERITTYNDDTTPYTIRYLVLSEYRSFYQGMYSAQFEDNYGCVIKDELSASSIVANASNYGLVESGGEYRYEGANPNNYITFNNETWRIIGIFDVKTSENGPIEKRIKLIKNDNIGEVTFGGTDWGGSTLAKGLNNNSANGIAFSSNISFKLNPTAQGLIDNALWYVSRVSYNSSATIAYTDEKVKTWIGKIGMMNASDYGFASSTCKNGTRLSDYDNSTCTSTNWLFNKTVNEWTITPDASTTAYNTLYIYNTGAFSSAITTVAEVVLYVRPVVYLKSDAKISGCGTIASPFVINDTNGGKLETCPVGTYLGSDGSTCVLCAQGSYSNKMGATECTACTGATTIGTGQISCNANCEKTNVSEWNTASWNTNNTVSNLCSAKTCSSGYKLNNNGECVLDSCTVYCTNPYNCSKNRPGFKQLYGVFTCTGGKTGSIRQCYYGSTICRPGGGAGANEYGYTGLEMCTSNYYHSASDLRSYCSYTISDYLQIMGLNLGGSGYNCSCDS